MSDGQGVVSEKDWVRFFAILEQIVDLPGAWREKRVLVLGKAEEQNSEGSFGEFLGWFEEGNA